MKYLFTVSARLVSLDEFDELSVSSNDVDVNQYPSKIAVIRGAGFRRLCSSMEDAASNKRIGQLCAINLEISKEVWESL